MHYFGEVKRQRFHHRSPSFNPPEFYDGRVRSLLAGHREQRVLAWRTLAAYVPRFYERCADDVFASVVTEDDARLAVARDNGSLSWGVLLQRSAAELRQRPDEWDVDPITHAVKAMKALDLDALRCVVEAHSDLLHPTDHDTAIGRTLLRMAIHQERVQGIAVMRPIMDWLATQGLDLQRELNRQLCGHRLMKTDKVRWLLDRGADPNSIAPDGSPVLEHALIRYWNGAAVDVLAASTTPRKALWISAGLGDVDGVRRSLDRHGKPAAASRRLRPDFAAVGPGGMLPPHPDPGDEEILMEAFFVAALNGRTAVLEYMVSRGVPVDSLVFGSPLISVAVGNAMTPIVECLVRCGANLDLRGWGSLQSARVMAREMFEQFPQDDDRRRVALLCAMDPDAILAERDARPLPPPVIEQGLQEALGHAGDDALRRGQPDIRTDNLLFGLLRKGGPPLQFFTKVSQLDLDRFRAEVAGRVWPAEDRVDRAELPLHPEAQAALDAAITIAVERRRESVSGLHLLYALTRGGHGAAAELLAHYGSSAASLNESLEGAV